MSEAESKAQSLELRDYFRILWLRKWTAILVTAVVLAGAMFLSYRQTPVYEASGTLEVPAPTQFEGTNPGAVRGGIDIGNEAQIAQSQLIGFYASILLSGGEVFNLTLTNVGSTPEEEPTVSPSPGASPSPEPSLPETGLSLNEEQKRAGVIFLRGVQVAPSRQSSTLLTIRVTNTSPEKAAAKALAIGAAYLAYKRSQAVAAGNAARANTQAQIVDKQRQLDEARAAAEDDPTGREGVGVAELEEDLAVLRGQRAQIDQAIDLADDGGDMINQPLVPKTPVRPNHFRDAIFAVIVGMVLGLGAAFLRDYLDDSLKGTEDVERQSGAPLIGVVPHVQAAGRQMEGRNGDRERVYLVTLDDPKAPASEAYRTLRTNLLFMSVSGPVGRLLITSPVAGEGKSTTAANLAVVLAQAGQRVLLVGSDLRRPSVHRYFGVSNRVGLSSVLIGQASLMEAVADPGIKGLRVMSGGPVPPNPTELLGSLAMKDFLDQAAQVTDWVLLDAPPVLGLADAAVLATLSDAALLVVNEATSRRVLAHARDQLAKVEARVVGTVLNNFGPSFSYYYSDYYAYTSQYYLAPEPAANGKLSRKDRRRQRKAEEAASRGGGLAFEEEGQPAQPVGQRSAARSAEDFWNENPT